MSRPHVYLPPNTLSRTYFIDEAGTKGTLGDIFVVAAVRTPDPSALLRAAESVRSRHGFRKEFKFGDVTKNKLPVYIDLLDAVAKTSATFGVCIVDKREGDPWGDKPGWHGNLWATERLMKGMLNRREVATVLMDEISVPAGMSAGKEIKDRVNRAFNCLRIASAVHLNSQTNDGLQVADLVASSARHYIEKVEQTSLQEYLVAGNPKSRLGRHVAQTLGVGGFEPCKLERVKILKEAPFPGCVTAPNDYHGGDSLVGTPGS